MDPGHVNFGGNERVDRISKSFASSQFNSLPFTFDGGFHSQSVSSEWVPSYPLTSLPAHVFLQNLLKPVQNSDATVIAGDSPFSAEFVSDSISAFSVPGAALQASSQGCSGLQRNPLALSF